MRLVILEDVTKKEVNDIVSKKVNSIYSSQDFKKEVKKIVGSVFEEWFKELHQRRSATINTITR